MVSKIVEHGTPIPVSKTEVLKNNLNPIWKPLSLSVQQVGSKVYEDSYGLNEYKVSFSIGDVSFCFYNPAGQSTDNRLLRLQFQWQTQSYRVTLELSLSHLGVCLIRKAVS